MDFVYVVLDTWVNDDGWAISAPSIVIAFTHEEDARKYVQDNTKTYTYTNSRHELTVRAVPIGVPINGRV